MKSFFRSFFKVVKIGEKSRFGTKCQLELRNSSVRNTDKCIGKRKLKWIAHIEISFWQTIFTRIQKSPQELRDHSKWHFLQKNGLTRSIKHFWPQSKNMVKTGQNTCISISKKGHNMLLYIITQITTQDACKTRHFPWPILF